MAEVQKYSLIEKLDEADKLYMNDPSLLGITALTYPTYINAMRGTMWCSHSRQFLNLLNPEFPALFTGVENLVGENSDAYHKAEHDYKVYRKVCKFDDLLENPMIYQLFYYDIEDEKYDVLTVKPCESLTENFGYKYINDTVNKFKEGDVINKDTIMARSTSYDKDMNYGFGINANIGFTLNPYTSEDAALVRKGFCEKMTSIETDEITVGINQNDFLINKYGKNGEYKPLPDIGETVSNKVCALRREFLNQLLFDFKDSSLNEIHEGDKVFFIDKDSMIIDYDIYDNTAERTDSPFLAQIYKYLDSQTKYYEEIYKTCEEIIHSGKKYSNDIDYLYSRSEKFLNKDYVWVNESGGEFSGFEIKIHYLRKSPLTEGCKISGRYGNKSVVSEVIDDDKMPHTKDGRVLDVLVNLLAITNRTTAEVIIELFVTGAAYQTQLQMRNMKTLKEREKLLFDFIKTFNEGQAASFYSGYKKLDTAGKRAYIDDAMYGTILIHQPPIGETTPMFYRCMYALEKFPYLKEDDLYINKWGREIKVLNKTWVGTMYCVKSLTLLVVILIENYTNCWEISIEFNRSTTIENH